MDGRTSCRHATRNTTSSSFVATMWGLWWPRSMTTLVSTGASVTRTLKFWTVARACWLMGKMQMHCTKSLLSTLSSRTLHNFYIFKIHSNLSPHQKCRSSMLTCTLLAESHGTIVAYLICTPSASSRERAELLAEPDAVCLFVWQPQWGLGLLSSLGFGAADNCWCPVAKMWHRRSSHWRLRCPWAEITAKNRFEILLGAHSSAAYFSFCPAAWTAHLRGWHWSKCRCEVCSMSPKYNLRIEKAR